MAPPFGLSYNDDHRENRVADYNHNYVYLWQMALPFGLCTTMTIVKNPALLVGAASCGWRSCPGEYLVGVCRRLRS